MRAETPAAWAVLAYGTEVPATFPQGLMQERRYRERVARETFPADPPRRTYEPEHTPALSPRRGYRRTTAEGTTASGQGSPARSAFRESSLLGIRED